jgi:cytochrome P450
MIPRDRIAVVTRLQQGWGDVAELALGPVRLVIVSEPLAAERILRDSSCFVEKGIGLAEARYLLGDGLLTASGERWIEARQALAGLFRCNAAGEMMAAACARIEAAIPQITQRAQCGPLALEPYLQTITLQAAARALLGIDLPGGSDTALGHFRAFTQWAEARVGMPVGWFTRLSWLLSRSARRSHTALVAMARQIASAQREVQTSVPGALARAGVQDFCSIAEQVLTVLLAGHETTAAAAAWTLDQLARHPPLAELVAEEGAALNFPPDMAQLPFTTAVVKETLRLFPPVWALPRRARADNDLAAFHIRTGTQVLVNVYGIHRHPRHWERPQMFEPERFLTSTADPAYFLPFGKGSRQCIGRHFGLATTTLLVARLAAAFCFSPCHAAPRPIAGLVLRPDGPPRYMLEPRRRSLGRCSVRQEKT